MKAARCIAKRLACSLVLSLLLPAVVQPYERHLDSEVIGEAFNLGRTRGERMGVFLSQYVRTFPTPPKGAYIGSVELLTPYTQIVYAAKDDLLNDSELDAERMYSAVDLPLLVRVRVYWVSTSESPSKDNNIWSRFVIAVSQRHPLTPIKRVLLPQHLIQRGLPRFDYVDMQLEFSTADVLSEPVTIDASSPGGQHIEAKFDLGQLK